MLNKPTYKELEQRVNELEEEIEDHKHTEKIIKNAKEEAERASNAKSQFLSVMCHELRVPLASVLGFSQLLEYDIAEQRSELRKESIGLILKSGVHILNLINDINDLSRIESGRLQISIECVDIISLIEEVLTLIKPMAEKHFICLKNCTDDYDFLLAMVDTTRIKQVLFNLISNAIKYNKVGGSVALSCEEKTDGLLRLSVRDTGLGIPEEKLPDLFKPFNRLGAETTEVDGTGIGLTITKHLVELMGGTIGVESSNTNGSCFYVDLVRAKPEQQCPVRLNQI